MEHENVKATATNYINDIRSCVMNLVEINVSNPAALKELNTLSVRVLALHKHLQLIKRR